MSAEEAKGSTLKVHVSRSDSQSSAESRVFNQPRLRKFGRPRISLAELESP